MVLGCLAPIEHAVVADDASPPMPKRCGNLRREGTPRGGLHIPPRRQEQQLAGIVNALEHLVVYEAGVVCVEPEVGWERVRAYTDGAPLGWCKLSDGDDLGLADLGLVEALLRNRQSRWRCRIVGDLADAQVIV